VYQFYTCRAFLVNGSILIIAPMNGKRGRTTRKAGGPGGKGGKDRQYRVLVRHILVPEGRFRLERALEVLVGVPPARGEEALDGRSHGQGPEESHGDGDHEP